MDVDVDADAESTPTRDEDYEKPIGHLSLFFSSLASHLAREVGHSMDTVLNSKQT